MKELLTIVFLALSVVTYYNLDIQEMDSGRKFESYIQKFGKTYPPTEYTYRQGIYEANLKKIEQHNADKSQTYQLGETLFSDLTQDEFESIYLTPIARQLNYVLYTPEITAESAVDWSNVTDVKYQGQYCRSGWAFSAIGAIESVVRIKGNGTKDLSEQQLIDCDTQSYQCSGGWSDLSIFWSSKFGNNLATEYPYLDRASTCRMKTGHKFVNGVRKIQPDSLQAAITNYPVSVVVDANNWSQYSSGIFNYCGKNLNHAVLAVGYYADGTWIIKNSWGTYWGEKGFIRLAAGDTCGVTQEAYIAEL